MEKKPRGWRRPEAPRKASGFIRNSREAVREKGARSTRRGRTAGEQGWVLEMLGKLLKGWSDGGGKEIKRQKGILGVTFGSLVKQS